MELPEKKVSNEKKSRQKKADLYRNSSFNELNELSSKSLLANVLDINDDFGVINVSRLSQKATESSRRYVNPNSLPHSRSHSPHQHYTPTRFGGGSGGVYRRTAGPEMTGFSHSVDEAPSSTEYAMSPATAASIHRTNEIYSLRKNLNHILRELKVITAKIKEEEEHERNSLNWKFAAMVIGKSGPHDRDLEPLVLSHSCNTHFVSDRLCMVFFAIATFFSFVIILLTSKNFFMLS